MSKTLLYAAAVIGVAGCALAHAGGTPFPLPQYQAGSADGQRYDRVVVITADGQAIDVSGGETVKFVDAVTHRSFVWHFGAVGDGAFDLAAVAPAGALSETHLMVNVAQGISGDTH